MIIFQRSVFFALAMGAASFSTSASGVGSTGTAGNSFGYLGLLAGAGTASRSQENATPAIGVTLGTRIAPSLGLGVLGTYFEQRSSGMLLGLPAGTSANTAMLTGQINYFIGGLHFGGEAGVAWSSWSGRISNTYADDSKSDFIYGPVAGFDMGISQAVSLGIEGHYLMSASDYAANNLQVFAAVKFWQ